MFSILALAFSATTDISRSLPAALALVAAVFSTVSAVHADQRPDDEDWSRLAAAAASDVTRNPFDAQLLNRYGYYEYRAGATRAALEAYERSLQLDPSYAVAWNNLGVLYLSTEQYADAQEAFEEALRHDEEHSKAKFNLAVANFRQGSYYRAIRIYLGLRRSDPDYVERRSDEDMAKLEFEEALRESPNDPVLRAVQRRLQREEPKRNGRDTESPLSGY